MNPKTWKSVDPSMIDLLQKSFFAGPTTCDTSLVLFSTARVVLNVEASSFTRWCSGVTPAGAGAGLIFRDVLLFHKRKLI